MPLHETDTSAAEWRRVPLLLHLCCEGWKTQGLTMYLVSEWPTAPEPAPTARNCRPRQATTLARDPSEYSPTCRKASVRQNRGELASARG